MFKHIFIAIVLSISCASHAEELWSWTRVEGGIPQAVVMRGSASTLAKTKDSLTLRLSNDDRRIHDFVVTVKISGREVIADFEPPNSEKVMLRVQGTYRESAAGNGTFFEQFILANTSNGNFFVISRFRSSKN